MKIKFCGASRFVTGSCHLITLDDGYKILLDCGLYQGHEKDQYQFNTTWKFNPAEIDCVILSHAHIDHCGRLPRLVKDGFNGRIFATHATRSLCSILLLDSAYIQEKDTDYYNYKMERKHRKTKTDFNPRKPLYRIPDVKPTMEKFVGLPYDLWNKINNNVKVCFRDAGHILGSASVTLRIEEHGQEYLIGFSGDIGRPQRPILRDPQPMPEVDYLICESTYGNREHESKPDEHEKLLNILKNTCVENKGKLIIPAFSIGRTQEIVYMLDQMETFGELPRIPVYVDSPLAVDATQIYGSHPECYDNELNEYLLKDPNPFGFKTLSYVRDVAESKMLNTLRKPCLIISASGMMNAGRVRHHLYNHIDDSKNTFLIVGYCAPGTPGRMLTDGVDKMKMFGDVKPVKATIKKMESFSAHGDKNEILEFIKNQKKVKEIFLVHGEYEVQKDFSLFLGKHHWDNVQIPDLYSEFQIS